MQPKLMTPSERVLGLGDHNYYELSSDLEAERLRMMAEFADHVSFTSIDSAKRMLDVLNPTVVDVGCGDSTTLGLQLREHGSIYVPVDMRTEAVGAQVEAGFEAIQSLATNLDISSSSADIIHSRFTWGWLKDDERDRAFLESIRIGKDCHALIVADYDWSVVEGPEPFMLAVNSVKDIMRDFGFDPEYGAVLPTDILIKLEKITECKETEPSIVVQKHPTFEGNIGDAFSVIYQTAQTIIDQLQSFGMDSRATEMIRIFEELHNYVKQNPETHVKLPEIVVVNIVVRGKESILTPNAKCWQVERDLRRSVTKESLGDILVEGIDYETPLKSVEEYMDVHIVISDKLKFKARQIQANAYIADGMVYEGAIKEDGTLVEDIDHQELIERSRYFISLDSVGKIKSTVRMIEMDHGKGWLSLPTLERMHISVGDTLKTYIPEGILSGELKAIEVSALAKDPLSGNILDVVRALLVLGQVAKNEGYDFAIMGLEQSKLNMIQGIFGQDTIKRIDGDSVVQSIESRLVSDNVRLIPLIVDVQSFIENVNKHALEQYANGKRRTVFDKIITLTNQLLEHRRG